MKSGGRKMTTRWTKESILADAKKNNVRFIRLMFTDILGTIKNVEIPLSQLEKALDSISSVVFAEEVSSGIYDAIASRFGKKHSFNRVFIGYNKPDSANIGYNIIIFKA